ncbi:MAG: S-layer homology domain-containing protein [Actinomycetota bacterium]|nr:S-layer homology domain-containing protein [Actinomycetota bacterium]
MAMGSALVAAAQTPAGASQDWYTLQFACEGITVPDEEPSAERTPATPPTTYITEFDGLPKVAPLEPGATYPATTVARWGVGGYFPLIGHEFATSSVLVTHFSRADGAEVLVDEPVPAGQEAVLCRAPGFLGGATVAEVVFLSPIPAPPPSVVFADRTSSSSEMAPPGTYQNRIVRSDRAGGDGCYAASRVEDLSRLEKFCATSAVVAPALFDVVDITVSSDLVATASPPPPQVVCPTTLSDRFMDDDSSVHEGNVNCAAAHQLVSGTTPTTYDPTANLTRGQAATILVNYVERSTGATLTGGAGGGFGDTAGSTHARNIEKAAASGIVTGFDDGTFRPNDLVSRAQFATIASQATERALGPPLTADRADAFDDDDGSVHEGNIEKAFDHGILEGTAPRTFSPHADVQRGQAATIIVRATSNVLFPAGKFTP